MERALVAFGGGAVVGALGGGLLIPVLSSMSKDLRDRRLHAAGMRGPSDRVTVRHHWLLAVVGALQATALVQAVHVPTSWAVLSVLVYPAGSALGLILSVVFGGLVSYGPAGRPPSADFDPAVLLGMDIQDAVTRLANEGWAYRILEERWGLLQPPYSGRHPHVALSVNAEKVTQAEIVQSGAD